MSDAPPAADFLTRLASKALGLGPIGAPRAAGMFEPESTPWEAPHPGEDGGIVPSPPAPERTPPPTIQAEPQPVVAAEPRPVVSAEPAPSEPARGPPVRASAPATVPATSGEPSRNGAARSVGPDEAATIDAPAAAPRSGAPEPPAGEPRQSPAAVVAPVRAPQRDPASKPLAIASPRGSDREPAAAEDEQAPSAAPAPVVAPDSPGRQAVPARLSRVTFAAPLAVPFAQAEGPSPRATAGMIVPLQSRGPRPDPVSAVAPPEPQTVNITIGRVEVRAAVPPPAERKAAPIRRGEPPQSLADYLKRREGAR